MKSPLRGVDENPEWRRRTFRLDETHHPKVERLSRWGEWFLRRACLNVRDKGTWLVISGKTGTGKSHVGSIVLQFFNDHAVDLALCKAWPNRVPKGVFVDWSSVVRRLKGRERIEDVLCDALESQLVILDDIGSESDQFKSGEGADALRWFLEKCESKFMLITANYGPKEWTTRFDARVADRLDSAHHFDTTGIPSFRPKLKG